MSEPPLVKTLYVALKGTVKLEGRRIFEAGDYDFGGGASHLGTGDH